MLSTAFRFMTLPALLAVLMLASIAAMPSVPTQPNQPTVVATANGGELRVTWNSTPETQFYTIGWTNYDEYQQMQNAGREWLDAFHFVTIPASYTSHTIKDLQPNGDYYVIIGARTSRLGGEAPVWSPWSNLVATAGQHGEGFCPVTGVPLPPSGYLSIGDTATAGDGYKFTLNGVTKQSTITSGVTRYLPVTGRQFIKVCTTVTSSDYETWFLFGTDYNLSTDAGIGFAVPDDSTTGWLDLDAIPANTTRSACDIWEVPSTAGTVVVAYNNFQSNPTLYKVDLP